MVEKETLTWFLTNWPSIVAGLIAASIYVRLTGYAARLDRIEKRQRRLMNVCSETHPEKARALFDDGNGA